MPKKITIEELGEYLKKELPDKYSGVDALSVGQQILEKHPEYKDMIKGNISPLSPAPQKITIQELGKYMKKELPDRFGSLSNVAAGKEALKINPSFADNIKKKEPSGNGFPVPSNGSSQTSKPEKTPPTTSLSSDVIHLPDIKVHGQNFLATVTPLSIKNIYSEPVSLSKKDYPVIPPKAQQELKQARDSLSSLPQTADIQNKINNINSALKLYSPETKNIFKDLTSEVKDNNWFFSPVKQQQTKQQLIQKYGEVNLPVINNVVNYFVHTRQRDAFLNTVNQVEKQKGISEKQLEGEMDTEVKSILFDSPEVQAEQAYMTLKKEYSKPEPDQKIINDAIGKLNSLGYSAKRYNEYRPGYRIVKNNETPTAYDNQVNNFINVYKDEPVDKLKNIIQTNYKIYKALQYKVQQLQKPVHQIGKNKISQYLQGSAHGEMLQTGINNIVVPPYGQTSYEKPEDILYPDSADYNQKAQNIESEYNYSKQKLETERAAFEGAVRALHLKQVESQPEAKTNEKQNTPDELANEYKSIQEKMPVTKGGNLPEVQVKDVRSPEYWAEYSHNLPEGWAKEIPEKTQKFLMAISRMPKSYIVSGEILQSKDIADIAPKDYVQAVKKRKEKIKKAKENKEQWFKNASLTDLEKAASFYNSPLKKEKQTYVSGQLGPMQTTVYKESGKPSPAKELQEKISHDNDVIKNLSAYLFLLDKKLKNNPTNEDIKKYIEVVKAYKELLPEYLNETKDYAGKVKQFPYYVPYNDVNILSKVTHLPKGFFETLNNSVIGKGVLALGFGNPDFRNTFPTMAEKTFRSLVGLIIDSPLFWGIGKLSEGVTDEALNLLKNVKITKNVASDIEKFSDATEGFIREGMSAEDAVASAADKYPDIAGRIRKALKGIDAAKQGVVLGSYNTLNSIITDLTGIKQATPGTKINYQGETYTITNSNGDNVTMIDEYGNEKEISRRDYNKYIKTPLKPILEQGMVGFTGGAAMPYARALSEALLKDMGVKSVFLNSVATTISQSIAFAASQSLIEKGRLPNWDDIKGSLVFMFGLKAGGKIAELINKQAPFYKYREGNTQEKENNKEFINEALALGNKILKDKKLVAGLKRAQIETYSKVTSQNILQNIINRKEQKVITADYKGNEIYITHGATIKDGKVKLGDAVEITSFNKEKGKWEKRLVDPKDINNPKINDAESYRKQIYDETLKKQLNELSEAQKGTSKETSGNGGKEVPKEGTKPSETKNKKGEQNAIKEGNVPESNKSEHSGAVQSEQGQEKAPQPEANNSNSAVTSEEVQKEKAQKKEVKQPKPETKPVSKELEPLIREAKKYKSAKEFGKAMWNIYKKRDNLIHQFNNEDNPQKQKVLEKQLNEINNNSLYKVLEKTAKIINPRTDDAIIEDVLGNRFAPGIGVGMEIPAYENPAMLPKLEDFYNQATKKTKEVKQQKVNEVNWQPVNKNQIKPGDIIKVEYNGKTYFGKVKELNSSDWAKLTKGRFAGISVEPVEGLQGDKLKHSSLGDAVPWTSGAKYFVKSERPEGQENELLKKGFTKNQIDRATPETLKILKEQNLSPKDVSILPNGELSLINKGQKEKPQEVKKEPWQMTKEDVKNKVLEKYTKEGFEKLRKERPDPEKDQSKFFSWSLKYRKYRYGLETKEGKPGEKGGVNNPVVTPLREHYEQVKQALSEGKPVPEEVLKNYPDLEKKYGKEQKKVNKEQQKENKETITEPEIKSISKAVKISPKNLRDVYKAGREIFGLNKVQSLAQAIIVDRIVGKIASRRGVTKDEVYKNLEFRKSKLEDLPKETKNLYQSVWHGSPYEFEKFRLEHIGTGEGAQVFGWGLYFTDKKEIAETYAKKLSKPIIVINGKDFDTQGTPLQSVIGIIVSSKDKRQAIADLNQALKDGRIDYRDAKRGIDFLESVDSYTVRRKGNIYKVKIHGDKNVDELNYLRWDKQVPKGIIQKLINGLTNQQYDRGFYYGIAPGTTGGEFYKKLSRALGGHKEASLYMLEHGIDGIQYPTEITSKGSHEDSFNYVIFDDKIAQIEDHIKFQKDQGTKGAFQILEDGKAIIHALTDPNVSTPVHEIAHYYEKYLTTDEKAKVLKWTKQKSWDVTTSEKFARGFEKYLSEGKAPSENLKPVFERFKRWLINIYNGIKGSQIDLKLNDPMRKIYANMLGEKFKEEPVKEKIKPEKQSALKITDDELKDLASNIKFQKDVKFQGGITPEEWMKKAILAAKERGIDPEKFLKDKIKEFNLPIKDEDVEKVLRKTGDNTSKKSTAGVSIKAMRRKIYNKNDELGNPALSYGSEESLLIGKQIWGELTPKEKDLYLETMKKKFEVGDVKKADVNILDYFLVHAANNEIQWNIEKINKALADAKGKEKIKLESELDKEYKKYESLKHDVLSSMRTIFATIGHSMQGEEELDTDNFTSYADLNEKINKKPLTKEEIKTTSNFVIKSSKLNDGILDDWGKIIGKEPQEKPKFSVSLNDVADRISNIRKKVAGNRALSADPFTATFIIGLDAAEASIRLSARIAEGVEALSKAIAKGIQAMRNSDTYKKLTGEQQEKLEDRFKTEIQAAYSDLGVGSKDKKQVKTSNDIAQYVRVNYVDNHVGDWTLDDYNGVLKRAAKDLGIKPEDVEKALFGKSKTTDLTDEKKDILKSRREFRTLVRQSKAIQSLPELRERFANHKGKFTIEDNKKIRDYARAAYIERGINKPADVVRGIANDVGLSTEDVLKLLTGKYADRKITDAMWRKQTELRRLKETAMNWLTYKDTPMGIKIAKKIPRIFFTVKVLWHGTVSMITHAGMYIYTPEDWIRYGRNFKKQFLLAVSPKYFEAQKLALMTDPYYDVFRRDGLAIDAEKLYTDYEILSQIFEGTKGGNVLKYLNEMGTRGFFALKLMRLEVMKNLYELMTNPLDKDVSKLQRVFSIRKATEYTEEEKKHLRQMLAEYVNHSTGASNIKFSGKNKGLDVVLGTTFFAWRLEASRHARLIKEPGEAFVYLLNPKAKPEEKAMAKTILRRIGSQISAYGAALVLNQIVLHWMHSKEKINFTNPLRYDFWLQKAFGKTFDFSGGMRSTMRLYSGLIDALFGERKIKNNQIQPRKNTLIDVLGNYAWGKTSPFMQFVLGAFTGANFTGAQRYWGGLLNKYQTKTSGWNFFANTVFPIPVEETYNLILDGMIANGMKKPDAEKLLGSLTLGALVGLTGVRVGEPPKAEDPYTKAVKKYANKEGLKYAYMRNEIGHANLELAKLYLQDEPAALKKIEKGLSDGTISTSDLKDIGKEIREPWLKTLLNPQYTLAAKIDGLPNAPQKYQRFIINYILERFIELGKDRQKGRLNKEQIKYYQNEFTRFNNIVNNIHSNSTFSSSKK